MTTILKTTAIITTMLCAAPAAAQFMTPYDPNAGFNMIQNALTNQARNAATPQVQVQVPQQTNPFYLTHPYPTRPCVNLTTVPCR